MPRYETLNGNIFWILVLLAMAFSHRTPAQNLSVVAQHLQSIPSTLPSNAPQLAGASADAHSAADNGNPPSQQPQLTHGPLLGAVSATTIRIWARADSNAQLQIEYKRAGNAWPGITSPQTTLADATDFTGTVLLSGLAAKTQYNYRLLLNGSIVPDSEGTFTTVATPAMPDTFTFAVGADMRFSLAPFPILDHIAERAPSFMLMIGDQIYADIPDLIPDDLAAYEQKYREQWAEPHFRNLVAAVPTFMILDDHEIVDNWDSGKTGRYGNAMAAYEEYQGSHNPAPRMAGENFYAFSAGRADFYVLDTRSFRSDRDTVDDADKTMLGPVQKADLKAWLSSAQGDFKFIVTSVPWHDSIGGPDSWHGYSTERNEINTYIRDHCIGGVVFLSGDQHYVAIVRSELAPGHYLYEISPTPLGTAPHEFRDTIDDENVLFAYNASRAFGLIHVNTNAPAQLTIDVINAENASALPQAQPLVLTEQEISPACAEPPGDARLHFPFVAR